AALVGRGARLAGEHRLLPAVVPRQVDFHRGALPRLAVDLGVVAGLAGKAVDHGQDEPRTLAHLLGGEERVEGPRHHLRRHADAGPTTYVPGAMPGAAA